MFAVTAATKDVILSDPASLWAAGAFLPYDSNRREVELILTGDSNGCGIYVIPLRPESEGIVSLKGGQPDITFNYLNSERDKSIAGSAVLQAVAILGEMGYPVTDAPDGTNIQAWLEKNLQENHHWTSACSIGKVVSSKGLVVGTENLYVCDDSILPICNDGNTSMPAYAIAKIIGKKLMR